MKEFVTWLLSGDRPGENATLFGFWHLFYFFLVLSTCALITYIFRKRSMESREKVLRFFAFSVIALYIADFFLMPLSDSYGFQIAYYKLPFHICTLMGCLAPFAQFNKKFAPLKPTIVVLSLVPSMMWMCYPGSAIGFPPLTYVLIQTFFYHGCLFSWAVLNLTLGAVKLNIKNAWRELCGLLCILVWSGIGNTLYDGVQDWFFLENGMFGIPPQYMPFAVVGSIYALCLAIYGIYYGVLAISRKREVRAHGE